MTTQLPFIYDAVLTLRSDQTAFVFSMSMVFPNTCILDTLKELKTAVFSGPKLLGTIGPIGMFIYIVKIFVP